MSSWAELPKSLDIAGLVRDVFGYLGIGHALNLTVATDPTTGLVAVHLSRQVGPDAWAAGSFEVTRSDVEQAAAGGAEAVVTMLRSRYDKCRSELFATPAGE